MKLKLIPFLVLLAAVSCSEIDMSHGNSLWCTATVDESTATKGLEVFSDDLNTENNVFVLDAWLELANVQKVDPTLADKPHYLDGKDMIFSKGYWTGEGCDWRNQVKTNFWAVYPKIAVGRGDLVWAGATPVDVTVEGQKKPTFDFDMTSFSGSKTDAADATTDLLVAYASGYWDEDSKTGGFLKINFKHVLSGLRFKRGHIDSGYNIVEVKIGGLHLKGECSLTGSTSAGKDNLNFKWAVTDSPTKSDGLSQKIDAIAVSEGSLILDKKQMFVIPQEMSEITTISAVIRNTSEGTEEKREVPLSGYTWKPEKIYDYTLSYYKDKDELVVSVEEYNTSTGSWTD